MAATKSAGRVSIRVLPDSTRFKQDLEKSLRRIENQLKAKIEAELYLSRDSLAKLKRQIESLVVKIKPSIELNVSPEELEALKAKIEKMKPKVDVLLETTAASRRIAALTRTRKMDVWVNIKNSKALANFGRHMKGLAGLNVIGDSFEGALDFFRNIDTNSVKLAKLYSKVAALGSVAAASVGSISLMITDIAAIGNIGLLAPAFLTGLGISIGVLVAAFKDMSYVLQDLGPVFKDLQMTLSDQFWGQAEQPIRNMVDALMPLLKPNLEKTAKALGGFFGEIADSFSEILTKSKLDTMFDRMNKSIDILKGAVKPLTNAFTNLGLHGSKYFARFSNWIVKVSNQFDKFIERSAKNGDLDRWTENAIQGFKDLYGVAKGVWRMVGAVSDAAKKAKLPDLGDVADGLNRAADLMGSPRFQNTLSQLFAGAKSAVSGMLDGIKKLGPAIESATPSIKRVLEGVGRIGSRVGGMLAEIISNPKVQAGFEAFFAGIEQAVKNLEPAVKPFADSLGQAMKLVGSVIEAVSKLGAKIMIVLGPILDKIGNEFEGLVGPFSDSLMGLVDDLKPVLEAAYEDFIKPLVKFIKEELLPALDKLGPIIGPILVRAFKELGRFIKEELTPFFHELNDVLDKLSKVDLSNLFDLPKLADPKNIMPGFKGDWLGLGGGNGWENIKNDWENFKRPFNEWWLNEAWPGIESGIMDGWKAFESWINTDFGPAANDLWDTVVSQLSDNFGIPNFDDLGKNLKTWWDGVQGMVGDAYETFKTGFQEWLSSINPFDDILDKLFGKEAKSTAGLGGMGSKGVSGKITPEMIGLGLPDGDWLAELNATVNQSLADFWASIGENLASFGETISTNWNAFWGGLGTKVSEVWTNITTWIATKAGEIGLNISTFIETVRANWDSFWGGLPDKISQVWTAITTWITTKAGEIGANIASFIGTVRTNWDSFWNSLPGKISAVWSAIVAWIRQKIGEIIANVARFLGDVQSNMANGWETVKSTVSNAWNSLVNRVRQGVDDAVSWIRGLPGKAASALSNLGGTLLSSGASLIQGFIDGMNGMIDSARQTAAGIVQAIANFFPHSPAKEGAFSGRGYTTHSGRALVKDFAGGMMDNMNKVRSATKAITNAVNLGANMDLNTDLGENGITVDRREVTVQVYHPVAEPTSRTIEKASNTLRMANAL